MPQLDMNEFDQLRSAASASRAAPDALGRLLLDRFSCRGFLNRSVPRDQIETMLQIAQLSPSWCNSQPWEVTITEGQGTESFRQALYEHACQQMANRSSGTQDYPFPGSYDGVYDQRRKEVGWQLYNSVGVERGDREASAAQALENFRLFGAPHALIMTCEKNLGVYGVLDCGIYLSTLMVAAESLGIAMIAQAALATYGDFVRSYFGFPENRLVLVGVSFGWPDLDHPANGFRTTRAPVESAVTWRTD